MGQVCSIPNSVNDLCMNLIAHVIPHKNDIVGGHPKDSVRWTFSVGTITFLASDTFLGS